MSDKKNTDQKPQRILALSGGVGGAKLVLGLSKLLSSEHLTIVANTADDFAHLGLSISPDLDTVMYTLAQISNPELGWGLKDESWNMMSALKRLGGDTWFQLGDRDLATHLLRSQLLADGKTLSQVTRQLCQQLNVEHDLLPMTDDSVRTRVKTDMGELAFQEYFVREQCRPTISKVFFKGIEQAQPQPELMRLLTGDQLAAIIICPSNPFVSVEPILQLPGVRQAISDNPAPVIAVSPIVNGIAIKGPTAKMMSELEMPGDANAIAQYYGSLLDGFVIDNSDKALESTIACQTRAVCCTNTVMKTLDDRVSLAKNVLEFATKIREQANV